MPKKINNIDGANGDTTNRLEISTYQQSSQGSPFGDLIRLIAEHGSAKGGIKWYASGYSARVITSKTSPFKVLTGQTLILKINGGPQRTITFENNSHHQFTSGAASSDQISDIITKQLNYYDYPDGLIDSSYYGQAVEHLTQNGGTPNENEIKVAIYSCSYGRDSTIEITGGTALSNLGLSTGTYRGREGLTDLGDRMARQLAWIIAHDYPNNPNSNNKHQHISIEVPDESGEMQTRISISYEKDVAEIIISSSMLILNTYPLTIAGEGYKDLDFSSDNTGRKIARLGQIRVDRNDSGGDMQFRVFDNEGDVTTLINLSRLDKYIAFNGAIQEKIRSTANSSNSILTLNPEFGNMFVISGTDSISFIATTNWQAGSELIIRLQGAATLVHAAGSQANAAALTLAGSTNFKSGTRGSSHTFRYDGSGYSNRWLEVSRIVY